MYSTIICNIRYNWIDCSTTFNNKNLDSTPSSNNSRNNAMINKQCEIILYNEYSECNLNLDHLSLTEERRLTIK